MASEMEQHVSAPARVQAALRAAGLDVRIEEFPSSTRTAEDAAATVGTSVGQIVKSLVFLAGDSPVMALVSGFNRLDTERLAALSGATIGKANADAVRQATGYSIGGVPPIGFPAPIPTFIDRDLLQYDIVWAAAGTPRHVFPVAPQELVRITGGTVVDLKAPTLPSPNVSNARLALKRRSRGPTGPAGGGGD
jgi:prolyl-tRNA editing enzyme YbaK/EbsC (Cys-tRNA(Pro) deacylase)